MGLLDEVHVYIDIPTKESITKRATYLLKKHTTKRGARKKKPRDAKWLRKVAKAKIQQRIMKQQLRGRAQQFADFKRHIAE